MIYLTHYCAVEEPIKLVEQLRQSLDQFTRIALAADAPAGGERTAQIRNGLFSWLLESLQQHGCKLSQAEIGHLMEMDLELDAQGLEVWLQKREEAASA
mgnify:CR=1 FL=1